jgi:hypothetical protein
MTLFYKVLFRVELIFSSWGNFIFKVSFVGTKGRKPRSKDFSSRVSQFVYESKISLAIVILKLILDQKIKSLNRKRLVLLRWIIDRCVRFNESKLILYNVW